MFWIAYYQAFHDGKFESALLNYNHALQLRANGEFDQTSAGGFFWQRGLVSMGLRRMPEATTDFREALKRSKSGEFIHDVAQLSDWIVRARTGELLSATQEPFTHWLCT